MWKMFIGALVVSAVLQFIVTRQRAGLAIEEGAAESMWLRYPFHVVANALLWTTIFAALNKGTQAVRRAL
jgi:hypothetical protein